MYASEEAQGGIFFKFCYQKQDKKKRQAQFR
jgi:hypothetical protein